MIIFFNATVKEIVKTRPALQEKMKVHCKEYPDLFQLRKCNNDSVIILSTLLAFHLKCLISFISRLISLMTRLDMNHLENMVEHIELYLALWKANH